MPLSRDRASRFCRFRRFCFRQGHEEGGPHDNEDTQCHYLTLCHGLYYRGLCELFLMMSNRPGSRVGPWLHHAGIDNIVPFGGPPFYIPQKGGLHRHPTGDYYVARVEKFVHVSGLSDLADLCVLCQCPALGRDMNLRRTSFHNPMGLTNTHRVLDRIEAHPSIFLRRKGGPPPMVAAVDASQSQTGHSRGQVVVISSHTSDIVESHCGELSTVV
ncbi:hypothetical protein CBS147320_977 [Aspergillus niger]|nr:hypothetical protein CBS147320_977 [Aspergillus niger]